MTHSNVSEEDENTRKETTKTIMRARRNGTETQ